MQRAFEMYVADDEQCGRKRNSEVGRSHDLEIEVIRLAAPDDRGGNPHRDGHTRQSSAGARREWLDRLTADHEVAAAAHDAENGGARGRLNRSDPKMPGRRIDPAEVELYRD